MSLTHAGENTKVSISEPYTTSGTKQVTHPYSSWFQILPTDNPACGSVTYFIDSCKAHGSTFYSTNTQPLISMTPSTPTGAHLTQHSENALSYSLSKPYHEKVCYWTKTQGNHYLKKEIEIEVCGTAETTSRYREKTVNFKFGVSDVEIGGKKYATYDLTFLRASFQSASLNCQIREWELYDSDGSTLLQNSDDV